LLVVDVGATLELYSEFTRTGGAYLAFPDPQHHRLTLEELRDASCARLAGHVWSDPLTLDPARRSARVTRTIAAQLAALARSLEAQHAADDVAHFLMRCLFTMFAEDVGLLPNRSFTQLLADLRHDVASFPPMIEHLWRTMDTGGFSVILRTQIPRFNGELFADSRALPLDAATATAQRGGAGGLARCGAGDLWHAARTRAGPGGAPQAGRALHAARLCGAAGAAHGGGAAAPGVGQRQDRRAALAGARDNTGLAVGVVEDFLRKLAHTRVLDPACGTANFLYVTMEHLKRLEAEVLQVLRELGQAQMTLEMESVQVTPQQFLGIEINPRAAAIAELVLWIGFLQWHFRTRGDVQPAEPIVRAFHNIECRDAVLAWDGVEPLLDADGQPVTRWDGRTPSATPSPARRCPTRQRARPAALPEPAPGPWPAADFIVGNPPFIGTARMREALGDGYTEALRKVYPAMCRQRRLCHVLVGQGGGTGAHGAVQRFGFITTNSLRQTFNRRVLERHLHAEPPLSLRFAIPDHPWVDTVDGAAVRIAMTVASTSSQDGVLLLIRSERGRDDETCGTCF
jgi:hypothetical protein